MSSHGILNLDPKTQDAFLVLVSDLMARGGTVTVVGGSVRDMLLGVASHDLDLEVSGLDMRCVHEIVENRFSLDITGVSFSVLKARVLSARQIDDGIDTPADDLASSRCRAAASTVMTRPSPRHLSHLTRRPPR